MRVLVWPAADDASAWYRLKFPAFALAAQGADVVVSAGAGAGPRMLWDRDWSHLDVAPLDARVLGLAERPDADVVVVNRPARAHWAEAIPHLQAAGVRVVVDVDDDFASIPPGNGARGTYRHERRNGRWLERACLLADLVTCSTPDLARRYAPHGRFAVLPNLVPAWYLDVETSDALPDTIGWSGSVTTHPGDLESTGGAVRDVLASHADWSVHAVGTGAGVAEALRVEAARVSDSGGWLPFEEYPRALARIAVGIVPLADNRFNRSKSALKMAELSAVGVPVVASPTPDNRRLQTMGVGLLASSPREWREQLTRLVEDEDFRADCACRGREAMRDQTYESRAGLWWDAWAATLGKKAVA